MKIQGKSAKVHISDTRRKNRVDQSFDLVPVRSTMLQLLGKLENWTSDLNKGNEDDLKYFGFRKRSTVSPMTDSCKDYPTFAVDGKVSTRVRPSCQRRVSWKKITLSFQLSPMEFNKDQALEESSWY